MYSFLKRRVKKSHNKEFSQRSWPRRALPTRRSSRVSPGPWSSGLRAGRGRGGRGDVPACTCVSAGGARTPAAAESSPASGRSWTSCPWCSGDKHRMPCERRSPIGRRDRTNKKTGSALGETLVLGKQEARAFFFFSGSLDSTFGTFCKQHLP